MLAKGFVRSARASEDTEDLRVQGIENWELFKFPQEALGQS